MVLILTPDTYSGPSAHPRSHRQPAPHPLQPVAVGRLEPAFGCRTTSRRALSSQVPKVIARGERTALPVGSPSSYCKDAGLVPLLEPAVHRRAVAALRQEARHRLSARRLPVVAHPQAAQGLAGRGLLRCRRGKRRGEYCGGESYFGCFPPDARLHLSRSSPIAAGVAVNDANLVGRCLPAHPPPAWHPVIQPVVGGQGQDGPPIEPTPPHSSTKRLPCSLPRKSPTPARPLA